MFVPRVNGRTGTFPVRVTFFCQSCESESVNWIARSQLRFTAEAVIARALLQVFGKRQVSQLKELTADERRRSKRPAAFIWSNDAPRRLVDATAARLSRIVDLHRLFDVGRVSGSTLLLRQLHLAVLFA